MSNPIYKGSIFRSLRYGQQNRFSTGGQHSVSFFTSLNRPSLSCQRLSNGPRSSISLKGQRRSYYRHQPQSTSPLIQNVILYGFIGANVFVWWKWQGASKAWREHSVQSRRGDVWDMPSNFILSLQNLSEGRWWTLLSHAISHGDGLHLLVNMVTYHAFVSSAFTIGLSPLTIVGVAVGSAVTGGVVGLVDMRRKGQDNGARGASALVCGLAAYVTCLAPRLRFFIIPIPVPIPLWLLTPAFVAWDVYKSDSLHSAIGHAAHVGGTACGVIVFIVQRLLRI
ncbi:hypothetical protein BJ170DRAFT_207139 [Xylariales sp. AK1849]|nr:hypothetical protein BJ170DRAFT_207139 [Xylariales sp. AK1849]